MYDALSDLYDTPDMPSGEPFSASFSTTSLKVCSPCPLITISIKGYQASAGGLRSWVVSAHITEHQYSSLDPALPHINPVTDLVAGHTANSKSKGIITCIKDKSL